MTLGDLIDREVEEAVEENTRRVTHSTKVEAILELLEDDSKKNGRFLLTNYEVN